MNTDTVVAVALGVACIAAVGMASTTLESTVKTTPDDVIDFDSSSVPLGSGEIQDYDERVNGERDDATSEDATSGDASKSGDEMRAVSKPADQGEPSSRNKPSDQGKDQSETAGNGPGERPAWGRIVQSWLDRLLALLREFLSFLLSVIPLIAGLAALGACYYWRDRLRARLGAAFGGGDDGGSGAVDGPERVRAPTNDVTQAWHEMVSLLDVDGRDTKTPRECAAQAVDQGVDRSAVERLTEAFEEVRYGHASVTDERREKATEGLSRIRSQYGGDS